MAKMVKTTVVLTEQLRRDSISLAAKRGVFRISEIIREALALWIVLEEQKGFIHATLLDYEDGRVPENEMAEILNALLEAGK